MESYKYPVGHLLSSCPLAWKSFVRSINPYGNNTSELHMRLFNTYHAKLDPNEGAVRFENKTNTNPLYGLTGYTIVQDTVPIVKKPGTGSIVQFKFILGDVRDKEQLQQLVREHDTVIPLAAIVGMPACKSNPELATQVNYEQIKNIVDALAHSQQLIIPNTNSQYGSSDNIITESS